MNAAGYDRHAIMAGYDVWLMGFSANADDAVPELMSMFSISEERARKLAGAVPVAVKKNATQDVAERFQQRLEGIGAQVELRAAASIDELPRRSRGSRSVAPSRRRTGRGLGSNPDLPAQPVPESEGLPRRRTSSSNMEAISARPPPQQRRHSQSAMHAVDDRASEPSRPDRQLPATADASDDDGIAVPFGAAPRRGRSTGAPGSPVASRPPQRAAVVGKRSHPPDAADSGPHAAAYAAMPRRRRNTGELPKQGPSPMSGAPPGSSRPPPAAIPPAPRPMTPLTDEPLPQGSPSYAPPAHASSPPPHGSAPPSAHASVAPAPLPSAPPLGLETAVPPPEPSDYAVPALVALIGGGLVAWRLATDGSVFQGAAAWTWSVWLEGAALMALVSGLLRISAIHGGRGGQSFLGPHRVYLFALIPIAALVNWAIASTQDKPQLAGPLDAKLEVQRKIADACKRTAKDEASCDECCETDMVFTDTCECLIPYRCKGGETDANACKACCLHGRDGITRYRFVHKQGCICNADDAFFED